MKALVSLPAFLVVTVVHLSAPGAGSETENLWQRVVVIGASASAGFGTRSEIGPDASDIRMAEVVDRMIREDHETVVDASESLFFMQPGRLGKKAVDRARETNPTLVIALDFLFWFGYGEHPNRHTSLAGGLKLLEDFSCPVLVTTLPNMEDAVGRMLTKEMVPDAKTLASLNEEISKWARGHDHIILVPLASAVKNLRQGKTVKAGGNSWPRGSLKRLLQSDQLHPTVEGLAFMISLCSDALKKRYRAAPRSLDLAVPSVARRVVKEKKVAFEKKKKAG